MVVEEVQEVQSGVVTTMRSGRGFFCENGERWRRLLYAMSKPGVSMTNLQRMLIILLFPSLLCLYFHIYN